MPLCYGSDTLQAMLACSAKTDPGYEQLLSAAAMIQKTADLLRRQVETAGHLAQIRAVERRITSEVCRLGDEREREGINEKRE